MEWRTYCFAGRKDPWEAFEEASLNRAMARNADEHPILVFVDSEDMGDQFWDAWDKVQAMKKEAPFTSPYGVLFTAEYETGLGGPEGAEFYVLRVKEHLIAGTYISCNGLVAAIIVRSDEMEYWDKELFG